MRTHNAFSAALLCGVMVCGASLASCDRKVVETTKTTESPGKTKVEETSVTEHSDGTVTKETESKTINH